MLRTALPHLQSKQKKNCSLTHFFNFRYRRSIIHHFSLPKDGLARTKAGRAADADNAAFICCDCICSWIYHGFFPNHDAHICWWCCPHYIGDCPQLALFQSPSSQVVGPE